MRVLTVRQPWAWAIIHGGKDVENRTRNLAGDYRGPVAIQVALRADDGAGREPVLDPLLAAANEYRKSMRGLILSLLEPNAPEPWWASRGAIIGVVDMVGVHDPLDFLFNPDTWPDAAGVCSQWAEPGTFHLMLRNARPLADPLPWKGALGLRSLPADVEDEVLRRLA